MKHFGIIKLIFLFASVLRFGRANAGRGTRRVAGDALDVAANITGSTSADRALTVRASIAARNVGQGSGRTFTARLNPAAEVKSASVGNAQARFISRPDPRTKLQQVTVTLETPIAPGGAVNVVFDYRLPVVENSGLAAISPEARNSFPPHIGIQSEHGVRAAGRGLCACAVNNQHSGRRDDRFFGSIGRAEFQRDAEHAALLPDGQVGGCRGGRRWARHQRMARRGRDR